MKQNWINEVCAFLTKMRKRIWRLIRFLFERKQAKPRSPKAEKRTDSNVSYGAVVSEITAGTDSDAAVSKNEDEQTVNTTCAEKRTDSSISYGAVVSQITTEPDSDTRVSKNEDKQTLNTTCDALLRSRDTEGKVEEIEHKVLLSSD